MITTIIFSYHAAIDICQCFIKKRRPSFSRMKLDISKSFISLNIFASKAFRKILLLGSKDIHRVHLAFMQHDMGLRSFFDTYQHQEGIKRNRAKSADSQAVKLVFKDSGDHGHASCKTSQGAAKFGSRERHLGQPPLEQLLWSLVSYNMPPGGARVLLCISWLMQKMTVIISAANLL